MAKIGVTYVAPKGDSEVVEMQGVKFFNGQTVKIDEDKQERLLSKLRKNPHFQVDSDKKKPEPKGDEPKPDDQPPVQPLPLP